mgnify:CR=1 FL=1
MYKEIVEFISAFGYELEFSDKEQNKERYSNDNGFIDLWEGKKGVTIGIYNPETKQICYKRKPTVDWVEKHLESIKEH